MSQATPSRGGVNPRKGYASPALTKLDAGMAKARLLAAADPRDSAAKKMLSIIEDELTKRAKPGS